VTYSFYGLRIEMPEDLGNLFVEDLKREFPLFFCKNEAFWIKTKRKLVFEINNSFVQSPFLIFKTGFSNAYGLFNRTLHLKSGAQVLIQDLDLEMKFIICHSELFLFEELKILLLSGVGQILDLEGWIRVHGALWSTVSDEVNRHFILNGLSGSGKSWASIQALASSPLIFVHTDECFWVNQDLLILPCSNSIKLKDYYSLNSKFSWMKRGNRWLVYRHPQFLRYAPFSLHQSTFSLLNTKQKELGFGGAIAFLFFNSLGAGMPQMLEVVLRTHYLKYLPGILLLRLSILFKMLKLSKNFRQTIEGRSNK